jgi:hypothetical protein
VSVRRRAIKARVERDRELKRQRDAQTASLNEMMARMEADPEAFRAEVEASLAGLSQPGSGQEP